MKSVLSCSCGATFKTTSRAELHHTAFPKLCRARPDAAPVPTEDQEHRSLALELTIRIGPPGVTKDGQMWLSIEHKMRHQNAARDGQGRKARGVVAGVPDLMLRQGSKTFWIELKRRKHGKVQPEQYDMHRTLKLLGDQVAVCNGAQNAIQQAKTWGFFA